MTPRRITFEIVTKTLIRRQSETMPIRIQREIEMLIETRREIEMLLRMVRIVSEIVT